MRPSRWLIVTAILTLAAISAAEAQEQAKPKAKAQEKAQPRDRNAMVRNDRETFKNSREWVYNDLPEGIRLAKETGKPLLIVFRCIPCEACQEFDDEVARRDPIIRDLLDKFVCVRIVQGNTIDLNRFRYDFDQSFAIILTNADLTTYARYGTRSDRPEHEDMSLKGLRATMEGVLALHKDFDAIKASLAGKQVTPTKFKTPLDFPSITGRFTANLDYENQVARSCLHCHQIREAERHVYRDVNQPIPDEILYPYPDPEVLGLKLDEDTTARIETVAKDSIAQTAGLKVGDVIETLQGQPILSTADVQWVLQNTPAKAELPAKIRRDGKALDVTLTLPEGWRHGNISWRVTSWDLGRMSFGGMRLTDIPDAERDQLKPGPIASDKMAIRVKFVGQFGEHANAKRAGFLKDDVIVSFDGQTGRMTESDLFAYALQWKKRGDEIAVNLLRNGKPMTLRYTLR